MYPDNSGLSRAISLTSRTRATTTHRSRSKANHASVFPRRSFDNREIVVEHAIIPDEGEFSGLVPSKRSSALLFHLARRFLPFREVPLLPVQGRYEAASPRGGCLPRR